MTSSLGPAARKEIEMAVVAVAVLPGGDQDTYEDLSAKVLAGGLPDGCQVHVAGPVDEGWRIITVWDSPEKLQQFRSEKLLPALSDAGVEGEMTPEVNEAYRVITA
jgi:hypothetical protein